MAENTDNPFSKDMAQQTNVDLEKQQTRQSQINATTQPGLFLVTSHGTNHDMPAISPTAPEDKYTEAGDDVYNKFSQHRKVIMVSILSLCGFLAPVSSTAILAAVPEVAAEFDTNGSIINLSNAFYMLFMGFSPIFWGPLSQVYGRRVTAILASVQFFAFSIGTALSPNLASYFIFRILTAFQGTAFLIVGTACIGDIYRPVDRATALGFFLSGTLVGPAFGPFIGGVIVTFRSWRVIFWLQTALAGLGLVLVVTLLPETIHKKRSEELNGLDRSAYAKQLWAWTNPWRVVKLFRYPNLLITSFASSALVWNMYSLLTPIRYVLNPRFHLTSPIQSGLFYTAPGCGYLLGTFVGGRWADYVVRRCIRKRGVRIPEDRLRSGVVAMGIVIPACMLLYGWSIESRKGGIALPVIVMFTQGVAQLFCFPSLNTYCLDVMPSRSGEVIAGNYMVRYLFAALGTAVCLPAIQKIGVGWFSTISALFLVSVTVAVCIEIRYGHSWRLKIDANSQRR